MIVGRIISPSIFLFLGGNNSSGKMSASLGRTRRSTTNYFPSPVSSSSSAITDKETETKANGKRKHNGKKSPSSTKKKNRQAAKIKVERTKSFEPKWSGNVINDGSDEYPPVHTLKGKDSSTTFSVKKD